jgi:hypothetical protein
MNLNVVVAVIDYVVATSLSLSHVVEAEQFWI